MGEPPPSCTSGNERGTTGACVAPSSTCAIDFSLARVALAFGNRDLAFATGSDLGPLTPTAKGCASRGAALLHQRASVSYSASVEGLFATARTALRTAPTAHLTLHVVLRTPTVHYDSDAVVARVWTTAPELGDMGPASGVSLEVAHAASGTTKTISCGTVSAARASCSGCSHCAVKPCPVTVRPDTVGPPPSSALRSGHGRRWYARPSRSSSRSSAKSSSIMARLSSAASGVMTPRNTHQPCWSRCALPPATSGSAGAIPD